MSRQDARQEAYERAEEMLDRGETEGVRAALERWTHERPPDAVACALVGLAHFYDGDYAAAAPLLDVAIGADPDDVEVRAARGACRLFALDPDGAERDLRLALEADREYALAHYWLARTLDWRAGGDPARAAEAERHFAIAARADAEAFPLPVAIPDDEFDRVLGDAIAGLPARVGEALGEVTIAVERYPSENLLRAYGDEVELDVLGLYTGTALPERSHLDSGRLPDVIHLFKRNLELFCCDREELVREIRDTLLHEVGHYLGLDEEELDELGL